jgi:hypothetical protein
MDIIFILPTEKLILDSDFSCLMPLFKVEISSLPITSPDFAFGGYGDNLSTVAKIQ